MAITKEFGKISSVKFGFGGYQNCMFGLQLVFDSGGSSVGAFLNGGWHTKRMEGAQWSEADRSDQQADLCTKIISLLKEAKVDDITKLKGMPVELTIEARALTTWRILTEVL